MPEIRYRPASGAAASGAAAPDGIPTSAALTLLVALQRGGLRHRSDCGGKALCGTCRVRVLAGGDGLSPMTERERARLEAVGEPLDGSVRLACQARAARDAEIQAIL
ncbi:MAG: (2Fe-2S)-binding protein [Spirochaetaceae bacterium]|nr:(2Fe-2S)-binding protein [Spirochaetaceae bacterium]